MKCSVKSRSTFIINISRNFTEFFPHWRIKDLAKEKELIGAYKFYSASSK
jgi:hypothetical protein